MSLKQDFIKVLSKLETLMSQKGEHFRARAYSKAKDSLILHPNDIQNKEDLRGIKGIGKTIIEKFQEFKETCSAHQIHWKPLRYSKLIRYISSLKNLSKHSLSNLTPHPTYVFVHYSHPTLLQRVQNLRS